MSGRNMLLGHPSTLDDHVLYHFRQNGGEIIKEENEAYCLQYRCTEKVHQQVVSILQNSESLRKTYNINFSDEFNTYSGEYIIYSFATVARLVKVNRVSKQ